MKNLLIISLLFLVFSCQKDEAKRGLSPNNPFIIALIPSENAADSLNTAKAIQKYIEKSMSQKLFGKDEGFFTRLTVPVSYIAALEGFGSKRVDFAAISTLNYFIAVEKKGLPMEVILFGAGEDPTKEHYYSQIIVKKDSPIKTLEDLNNKSFAFTDPASTSGHIVPRTLLKRAKIKLKNEMFAGRHDNVATMVYMGKVDAGSTYHIAPLADGKPRDARVRILTQFPDAIEKLRILTKSDPIPNSPWVIRSNIYEDSSFQKKVKESLQDSFVELIRTEEGKKTFTALNNIQRFKKTTNKAYREKLKVFDLKDLDQMLLK